MVLPLGPRGGAQHIVKLSKTADGLGRQGLVAVRFVPVLPGQAREFEPFPPLCRLVYSPSPILKRLFTSTMFSRSQVILRAGGNYGRMAFGLRAAIGCYRVNWGGGRRVQRLQPVW